MPFNICNGGYLSSSNLDTHAYKRFIVAICHITIKSSFLSLSFLKRKEETQKRKNTPQMNFLHA